MLTRNGPVIKPRRYCTSSISRKPSDRAVITARRREHKVIQLPLICHGRRHRNINHRYYKVFGRRYRLITGKDRNGRRRHHIVSPPSSQYRVFASLHDATNYLPVLCLLSLLADFFVGNCVCLELGFPRKIGFSNTLLRLAAPCVLLFVMFGCCSFPCDSL